MATGNLGLAAAAGLYQSICGLLLVLASNFVVKKINPENAIF
jgi:putative aldouronate transport system permease protein